MKPDPSPNGDGLVTEVVVVVSFNNGVGSGLQFLGSYGGLFTGPGTLNYTQAGFVQLQPVPAPEPSSFALLASSIAGVVGLVWCRRRKATGPGSSS